MIIIEGPDGSGKTTLARRISEDLNLGVIHSEGGSWNNDPGGIIDRVRGQLSCRPAILDRCYPISELIYGKVFRQGAKLGKPAHMNILEDLCYRKYLFIYCRAIPSVIEKAPGEQIEGLKEKARELADEYDNFFREFSKVSQGEVIVWNRDETSYSQIIQKCTDHIMGMVANRARLWRVM